MPRYFVPISKLELAGKILLAIETQEENVDVGCDQEQTPPDKGTISDVLSSQPSWRDLTEQIEKDMKKVEFDFENTTLSEGYGRITPKRDIKRLMGFQTLPNGMSFLGITAGDDWEFPVYFIIYWDGKKLRAYIPKEGNSWNPINHKAIGNDGEGADLKYLKKIVPSFEGDYADSGDFPDDFGIKADKILADITERILPKP